MDAKYPKAFKSARYKDARQIIKNYFENSLNEDAVLEAINEFEKIEPESEFQENDKRASISALERALEGDFSELEELEIEECEIPNKPINIKGVDISIDPDLIVRDDVQVGAIKLHIAKGALSTEGQSIVAALLFRYTDEYIKQDGEEAECSLCFSIDIFRESLVPCPRSIKLRMKRIEAACEEIADRWGSL